MLHCSIIIIFALLTADSVHELFLSKNAFSTQDVEYLQTMATLVSMVQEGPAGFRYLS